VCVYMYIHIVVYIFDICVRYFTVFKTYGTRDQNCKRNYKHAACATVVK
jgi:hypothetical protein